MSKYTHEQLKAAFDQVANPKDWRGPICALVDAADLDGVRTAITYYTATIPSVRWDATAKAYRVESQGYRMGPAGP